MYPPGHLAINGIFVASYNGLLKISGHPNRHIPLWPAVIAAILPDLTDKVATDYLHWMPYGRNYLHNLTAAFVGGMLLALLFKRKEIGISWFVGILGHMVGDFVFVPVFWPWVSYDWPIENRNMAAGVVQTVIDLAAGKPLSPLAAAVMWVPNRIWMECVMFSGVIFFSQNHIMVNQISHRERIGAMILACVAWAYIIIKWDYPVFLIYARYYGL